ncbi:MAG: sigma-70 family RNA polymerase sigma factor [Pirellulaceae bacterium]|jgi:RNA polymerase sigma-70 factor (ECF subfamily)
MSTKEEREIRERMTRCWLSAEPSVRAYIAAAIRSSVDREDLLQQVALTVARRFDDYDPSRPFLPWVLWLAKSRIIDFYRTKQRRPTLLDDSMLRQLADHLIDRQNDGASRLEALEHCLEKLPDRSRRLLNMRYHQSLGIEKIAEAIRSTPVSVRVTLFRIREALADCIQRRLAGEAER